MLCDQVISRMNEIKARLKETEKDRLRLIEDMYDWMIEVVPKAADSHNLPEHLKTWVMERKKLRAELKELQCLDT